MKAQVRAYVVRRPTGVGVLSRGKDYSVKDLGTSQAGYTNLLKKELGVSLLADAPQTRWTQIHELSHVRYSLWSPDRVARYILKTTGRRVDVGCVLAAEDARINEIALRRVPDAHAGFALADRSGAGLRQDLGGYVASHASPAVLADAIRPACSPEHVAAVDAWLRRLPRMAERELSVLRVTVPLALLLDELQRKPETKPKPAPGKPAPEKSGDVRDDDESKPEEAGEDEEEDADSAEDGGADDSAESGKPSGAADDDVDDDDTAEEPAEDGSGADADDSDADADAGDVEALGAPDAAGGHACGMPREVGARTDAPRWIIPEVLEPALTIPLRGGNAMVTTAETGTSLRWASLHRIATDGVVFRKVRRRPGALQRGTVLVDASSSMAFTIADLDAIVAAMPYATVAVYSGQPGRGAHGGGAWVVVVARNGKRVRSITREDGVMTGYGNMCDGPALLWLSRQAAPRLWVCDGVVTRDNDVYSPELAEQCGAIMESAGILQVVAEGLKATCVRRLKLGAAPAVPALLAAVRDLERGRVRPA